MSTLLTDAPLGRKVASVDTYTPSLLYAIPRWDGREHLDFDGEKLPFRGVDIWNCYEVSWLDEHGKPQVATAEIIIPATSRHLVESKSLKLYLNSLNQTRFVRREEVIAAIEKDVGNVVQGPVWVKLNTQMAPQQGSHTDFAGILLDTLPLHIERYTLDSALLQNEVNTQEVVTESLVTHLFRSLCPVTQQPDWATILVRYRGRAIDHESLLAYLVSYRQHPDFHEQCVERIWMDIWHQCQPQQLTVYGRFTRRGGIDINPFRSNYEEPLPNMRMIRQ